MRKGLNTKYPSSFFSGGTAFCDMEVNALIVIEADPDTGAQKVFDYIDGELYDLSIPDYTSVLIVMGYFNDPETTRSALEGLNHVWPTPYVAYTDLSNRQSYFWNFRKGDVPGLASVDYAFQPVDDVAEYYLNLAHEAELVDAL